MRARDFIVESETKAFIRKHTPWVQKELGLKDLPNIVLQDSLDDTTFGKYVPEKKTLFLATANRHPIDVLRTMAHELTHYKQDLEGRTKPDSGKTGSPEENEANSVAGIIMRHFNQEHPEFLKMTIDENMDHDKDGQAVDELKAALEARRKEIVKVKDDKDKVYKIIDGIMTSIAKAHGMSGQKIHDLWVAKYKEIPDTWIMNEDISRRDLLRGVGAAAVGVAASDALGKELKQLKVADNKNSRTLLNIAKKYIAGTELAQFMAQCAHETANFSTLVELGGPEHFKKYDPQFNPKKAKELGNVKPGDGERYKGRGFLQITGRDNYKRMGDMLKMPLEDNPRLIENPEYAAWASILFWFKQVRNKVNNFNNTKQATKIINPGLHGLEDRKEKFQSYQTALNPPKHQKHGVKIASR
jgi:predicted chitinase